jgi:hypothetical protein
MKKSNLLAMAGATILLLPGCVVTSVCPFYTAKDLVSEPALVGDWIKEGKDANHEVWKYEKSGDLACRFTLIEPSKATVMEAHAFELQGQLFLDIASIEQDIHVIPPHYLLKVSQLTPTLRLSQLDHDWLKKLLGKDRAILPHHLVGNPDEPDELRVVLTAETPELQKFILEHLKTKEAWKDDFELKREQPASGARSKKP